MSTDNDLSFDDAWNLATGVEPEPVSTDTSTQTQTIENEHATNSDDQDTTSNTQGSTDNVEDGSATGPQTLEEAVAQAQLWEQRFKSFEGRVKADMESRRQEELERQKQFVDALAQSKESKQADTAEDMVPSKFQELKRDFPEIADAVEELLANKLSKTEQLVKQTVEAKITPLAEDFTKQRVLSSRDRILAKHSDAFELKNSGALDAWINTLPFHSQIGAKYVTDYGSPEEVIALLDQYKDYKTTKSTTNNQNTDKSATDQGERVNSQSMVAAIKAGMAVKSGKSAEPKTDIKKTSKDDFDAGWEDALKKLGMN